MDVMFFWMWYVAVTETNKLIICGSFAECYTRQKPYLSSAMKIHLTKRDTWQKSVLSRTKMASLPSVCAMTLSKEAKILCHEEVFAECLDWDTRQRSKVWRVPGLGHMAKKQSLPSARDLTLGKRAVTVSAPSRYFFSPSVGFSSRQIICRVPDRKHSAKSRLPAL